jgi:hypothetical protein
MKWLSIIVIAALWLSGSWPFDQGGPFDFKTEYMAEVGYYAGEERRWYVGSRTRDKSACLSEAISIYNQYNWQSSGRAFSWSCRIMSGDRFLDRTRG